jgi:hypothetical protein
MRHPSAPAIIAVLLGFLVLVVIFHTLVDYGHHEGNPKREDVPSRESVMKIHGEMDDEEEKANAE